MIQRLSRLLVGVVLTLPLMREARADTVTYYHNDLLGSPVAATNQAGQVIWRESYRPFGERLVKDSQAQSNEVWYTSKPQDQDTGLVYLGARYYDPVIGRFISTDPVGFDEKNIHSFNRYAYANNNPYKFVDPDGRNPVLVAILIDRIGGMAAGGIAAGVANAAAQQWMHGTVQWGGAGGLFDAISDGATIGAVFGLGLGSEAGAARGMARVPQVEGSEAGSMVSGLNLNKSLASQAQMSESGTPLAGAGSSVPLRDASRVTGDHGGSATDWAKKGSSSYTARDGSAFETHWIENTQTGDLPGDSRSIHNLEMAPGAAN